MSASLASVLRPGKTYTVSDDQYLTLFHKKFWGTSMQAEEVEWRRAQSAIGRGERNEESYQSADVSMEGDVEDEDSLPGCYYLDIDIEGLQPQGLWIRPDYVRIYDALHRDYPLPMDMDLIGKTPCAVITGQPGIGKSVWIWYATRRRMAAREPFVLYYGRRLRLFVEDGVYDVPDGWQKSDFRYFIWTFVDTDANKEGMPSDFVEPSTPFFIIFTRSPEANCWNRLHKTMQEPEIIIMNPWSKSEILQIMPPNVSSHIFDIFYRLGPTPRLCLLLGNALERYEHRLNQAIRGINVSVLEEALVNATFLEMDDMSHKLCLVTRKDRDNVYSRAVIHLITDWVKSRLALQLRTMEKAEQLRLMRMLSRVPESRPLAGVLFEAMAQSELLDGITLNLMRMVKKPGSSPQRQPQWHSSHNLVRNATLDTLREEEPKIPLTIHPNNWKEYSDNGPSSVEPNVMYIPQLSNQKVFDSFILVDGILHLFQFTIGSEHAINHGLVGVGEKYGYPQDMAKWHFTFVIPPNRVLKVSQAHQGPLKDLKLFSAILDVGVEIPVE